MHGSSSRRCHTARQVHLCHQQHRDEVAQLGQVFQARPCIHVQADGIAGKQAVQAVVVNVLPVPVSLQRGAADALRQQVRDLARSQQVAAHARGQAQGQ